MSDDQPSRQFVILNKTISQGPELDLVGAKAQLEQILKIPASSFEVSGVPSQGWRRHGPAGAAPVVSPSPRRIVSIVLRDAAHGPGQQVKSFRAAIASANAGMPPGDAPIAGFGADLALSGTEYFCPATLAEMLFGTRSLARKVTRAESLRRHGLTGGGVNVVVIDQGFDARRVRNFGGGWGVPGGPVPGATDDGHGGMIARNVMDAAPDAIFWDLPLIPTQIGTIPVFLSTALAQLLVVQAYIAALKTPEQWVFVNAWAIFDRATESPLGDYTQNTCPGGHPLNTLVGQMADAGLDFVFGAGNCGQFCPDRRCGTTDIGPGNSIWGANCHPRVVTVGATRTDLRWLGNASQGPGQVLLALEKPDLCAPSNFREDADAEVGSLTATWTGPSVPPAFIANTGTSAACGLAAGIVAALRSKPQWAQPLVPPGSLKQGLTASARKTEGPTWNGRLGHGVIDCEGAYDWLAAHFP